MMISGIYIIRSLIDEKKFYIGSTINLVNRKNEHWYKLRKGTHCNKKLYNYYKKHGAGSLKYEILEQCNPDELLNKEQRYIDKLNPYFNIRKIANSNRGLKLSDESKLKMSNAHKELFKNGRKQWNTGIPNSPEHKEKISIANRGMQNMKGKHHSEESKLKMSITRKGHFVSQETKDKISKANKNRVFSQEHKQKIRLSKLGNKCGLGRKFSKESKEKMIRTRKLNKLKNEKLN